jgi:hypothetical protein
MYSSPHTKGLWKEMNPLFIEIRLIGDKLQNATREFTKEELEQHHWEIEDIQSMATRCTKMDHIHYCKNRISDLLLRVLAERRNVKNIIYSL